MLSGAIAMDAARHAFHQRHPERPGSAPSRTAPAAGEILTRVDAFSPLTQAPDTLEIP
jgi:hypothetical protein